jgi:signal transduction histidine kinase
VPLSVHGRTVGCLVVHRNADSTTFADDELELAEGIARQLAVGLETVELLQAQRDEAAVASALARVSQELISSLDRPILLDRLCRIATEVLECDCAHSFLWEESDGAFVAVAGYGDPPEDWESLRTLQLPRRLMLGDEGNEREFWTGQFDEVAGHLGTLARQSGLITGLRVVLRRGDEMVGILTAAHRRTNRHFSIRHQRIARGISQLAVMALENARLVEALQQASRLKSDFVASMSHELRTPLNVIIGYNNLLMEGEFGTLNDDQVETTRRMRRSAAELFELINTTLDLSRLEAGRLPVSLSELRVTDLIEEIDAETAAIRQKDSVVFAWDVHTALPSLWTDRLKLKVVIKNLIGNAMKFTTRGRVTVSVHLDGDHVTFTVRDTGIGIPPDAQAVIFEPFRQAESSIGQNYGGVGLGLYIAQRLVTLLGGTIGVESVPDIGSTFHVALPRRGPS